MNCAWEALISILPQDLRSDVDKFGRETMQELRLRLGQPAEMVCRNTNRWLTRSVRVDDLSFVINAASRYSPWAATSAAQGYITAPGGHRVGICGECIVQKGQMTGVNKPNTLCIRVARDFPGIAKGCDLCGSVLILGPPGSGKTTLLRDLIRRRSEESGQCITVVDERGEIFPSGAQFPKGRRTDVLTGCKKAHGLELALRTMGPAAIAVDEITARADCEALLHAAWCGVDLLATAHACSGKDLLRRELYKPLAEAKIFDTLLVLDRDKTWRRERIGV